MSEKKIAVMLTPSAVGALIEFAVELRARAREQKDFGEMGGLRRLQAADQVLEACQQGLAAFAEEKDGE